MCVDMFVNVCVSCLEFFHGIRSVGYVGDGNGGGMAGGGSVGSQKS